MIILKWYSIIILFINLLAHLYIGVNENNISNLFNFILIGIIFIYVIIV